jgi:predicted NAD/FAD-binding protein
VANRPQWYTVRGGARTYVEKMLRRIPDARLNTPVRSVRRVPPGSGSAGVFITTDHGTERFDDVVLACHSDQSLALLADATPAEREVLGAVRYHRNRAVLHTDTSVLPKRRLAWAAWNYERASDETREHAGVCLHYLINRLQPLPFKTPVVVSLNPLTEPDERTVHGEFDYAHPVFDAAAIAAQQQLPQLQGQARTWFCGAWTRYGFHEDGLISGLSVCEGLRAAWSRADAAASLEAA